MQPPSITEPERTKILITVKTYPQLSGSHTETVCTAGVREGGRWVRIYPIAYRYLAPAQRREVYFFLGTNKQWHIRRSRNPFMIVGIFYPPK